MLNNKMEIEKSDKKKSICDDLSSVNDKHKESEVWQILG